MVKIEYLMGNSKNTVDLESFRPKKQLLDKVIFRNLSICRPVRGAAPGIAGGHYATGCRLGYINYTVECRPPGQWRERARRYTWQIKMSQFARKQKFNKMNVSHCTAGMPVRAQYMQQFWQSNEILNACYLKTNACYSAYSVTQTETLFYILFLYLFCFCVLRVQT